MLEVNIECGTIEDIKRKAYEKGVNDAFDAARKIESSPSNGGYTIEEIYSLFPDQGDNYGLLDRVLDKYSPMAIVTIVQDYEENKNKLHVGDIVFGCDCKGIITKISKRNPNKCYILWKDGSSGEWNIEDIIKDKTGEHMTIPEFLEKYGRIGE